MPFLSCTQVMLQTRSKVLPLLTANPISSIKRSVTVSDRRRNHTMPHTVSPSVAIVLVAPPGLLHMACPGIWERDGREERSTRNSIPVGSSLTQPKYCARQILGRIDWLAHFSRYQRLPKVSGNPSVESPCLS